MVARAPSDLASGRIAGDGSAYELETGLLMVTNADGVKRFSVSASEAQWRRVALWLG